MTNHITVISIIAILLVEGAWAQVKIGPMNMPEAGDSFPFSISTSTLGIDPSITGEDFAWDFSDLNEFQTLSESFIAVAETPALYQFFFNNGFLYPEHEADYAKSELDIDLGQLTLSDTYSYFKNDAQGLRDVGFGATINGLPVSVRNIPVDYIYEFPMSFGDSHTSSSTSALEIPGIGYYSRELDRQVEVEGWGTVTLPNASYEVLKIKIIINIVDSLYLETTQQGFSIPSPELTAYQWISPEEIQPVLEINQQLGLNTLVRYKNDGIVSIADDDGLGLSVFPNPSSDALLIRADGSSIHSYRIFDLSGKLIASEVGIGQQLLDISIAHLSRGQYHLMVETEVGTYKASFIKE